MNIKMISATESTIRETAKYRYTLEVQHWSTKTFHIRHENSIDGTNYHTREAAEAAIRETAYLLRWDVSKCSIEEWEGTDTVFLHHRYRVKA